MKGPSSKWSIIAIVLLSLVGLEFFSDVARLIPGYAALREAYPYYVPKSYASLIEILLVLLVAFAALRKTGLGLTNTLGLGRPPFVDVKATVLMVLPLYLVFALTFSFAEMVPVEVLYLSVISPFAEELAYRGFAFGLLRKVAGWGFWPAALVPAAFFAWGHIDQGNDLFSISMTLLLTGGGAILFAWLFERWGGLWVPLGLHVTMNFAWNLFAVGDGAYAGTLPTIMQVATVLIAITVTLLRQRIPFLRKADTAV